MNERTKNLLTERLPYYLVGLAIGLVMVGMIMSKKQQAIQRQTQPQTAPTSLDPGVQPPTKSESTDD